MNTEPRRRRQVCLFSETRALLSLLTTLTFPALATSLWSMSSEGVSKKRPRSSSNDDLSLHHHKSKRIPCTTPVIVNNSIPEDDTVADDGRTHHAFTSATGAPPVAARAQPAPSLSASKPACYAPYVWPHQKRDQVTSLDCTPMRDGDTWYLISRTWYEKWQAACNPALRTHRREADERLGPVDNSDIVGANGELIPGLSEGNGVYCASQRTMELFTQWYTLFCISSFYHSHALSIPGMALQNILSHAKSSPRVITRQSASNSILTS